MEEYAEDRYPVVLDVATGVGKEAMESHKVVIIIIILKTCREPGGGWTLT